MWSARDVHGPGPQPRPGYCPDNDTYYASVSAAARLAGVTAARILQVLARGGRAGGYRFVDAPAAANDNGMTSPANDNGASDSSL
jgi:hypothetical protein